FDAPVVLALAPVVGGAAWFGAAWARRVRIRRAALWSEETVRRAIRAGPLVLAVDISRSMRAEDAGPSRLGRALREARRLVQGLEGDRIGLVAFAGSSYILSPLSIDASA